MTTGESIARADSSHGDVAPHAAAADPQPPHQDDTQHSAGTPQSVSLPAAANETGNDAGAGETPRVPPWLSSPASAGRTPVQEANRAASAVDMHTPGEPAATGDPAPGDRPPMFGHPAVEPGTAQGQQGAAEPPQQQLGSGSQQIAGASPPSPAGQQADSMPHGNAIPPAHSRGAAAAAERHPKPAAAVLSDAAEGAASQLQDSGAARPQASRNGASQQPDAGAAARLAGSGTSGQRAAGGSSTASRERDSGAAKQQTLDQTAGSSAANQQTLDQTADSSGVVQQPQDQTADSSAASQQTRGQRAARRRAEADRSWDALLMRFAESSLSKGGPLPSLQVPYINLQCHA